MRQGAMRRVIGLLTPRERRSGLMLLGMIIVMALFDMVGVAAVMPFLAVLADPSMIDRNVVLAWLHRFLGMPDDTSFLTWLGLGAMALILAGAGVRTLTEFAINRFIQMRVHSLGTRLLGAICANPTNSTSAVTAARCKRPSCPRPSAWSAR